jgi:hypothetical protein
MVAFPVDPWAFLARLVQLAFREGGNDFENIFAELIPKTIRRDICVFEQVVQKTCDDHILVETEPLQACRYFNAMNDIGQACTLACLPFVPPECFDKCF